MKQIRLGVFETNSSSTHSLTICTKAQFDDWTSGKLYFDRDNEKFVSKDDVTQEDIEDHDRRFQTFDLWEDDEYAKNSTSELTFDLGDDMVEMFKRV